MKEFNIDLSQIGTLLAIGMIASWLLSAVAGPAMDYIGRKAVLEATLFFTALGSVFTAIVWSWGSLIAARTITQASSSAEMPAGLTVVGEELSPQARGPVIGLIQTGYPVGFFLASWVGSWIIPNYGWRVLFVIGLVPLIVLILARYWLREPERNVEVMALRREERKEAKHQVDVSKAKVFTYSQLFAPDLRKETIMCGLFVFFINFGAAGILFFMPAIVSALGFTLEQFYSVSIWGTACGILGYVSCSYVGNWLGRRNAVLVYLIPAIASLVLLANASHTYGLLVLFYIGFWVFGMGTYSAQMGYFVEIYPTRVRGTAVAFMTSCVWAGNTITSFLGPQFLKAYGPEGTLYIYGVGCFSIALLCFLVVRNVKPGLELEAIAT